MRVRYKCDGCGTIIEFTNTRMMTWKYYKKCPYCKDADIPFCSIPDYPDSLEAIRERAQELGIEDYYFQAINNSIHNLEIRIKIAEKNNWLEEERDKCSVKEFNQYIKNAAIGFEGKFETPAQYEKRIGKKLSDDAAVWVLDNAGNWKLFYYSEIHEGDTVVCANGTEPPDFDPEEL